MTTTEIGREAPEMVQRVAEAIRVALAGQGEHVYAKPHYEAKHLTQIEGCFDLSVVARAAIEAMREPIPAMVEAGRWPAEDEGPAACWQAMVDAALADRTSADQAGERR